MADRNQFEGFGYEAEAEVKARTEGCAVCEAMLPEAADGALSEAEQRAFDRHVAGCVECARELAEAQRGAAWLSMLKSEAPEPPVGMLERILAGTTGVAGMAASPAGPPMRDEAAHEWGTRNVAAPVHVPEVGHGEPGFVPVRQAMPAWALSSVWRRAVGAFRVENSRASFQPRLAMTAAMAFFSIALTLNLTGVRLSDLRAQDFTPSGMRRTVADLGASAERTFQNNRVVYQVESRVSELQNDEAPADGQDSNDGRGAGQGAADQGAGPSR